MSRLGTRRTVGPSYRVTTRGLRRTYGSLLGLGIFLLSLVALLAPATAHAAAQGTVTTKVADSAEAWYATTALNTCPTPIGCIPSTVTSSPYPKNTLHVAYTAGAPADSTYIVPNLAALPRGITLDSGTVTLPVDTATTSGTALASTAEIEACLVTSKVTGGVDGATSTPPTHNCKISAAATYNEKANTFTVPLATFAAAWSKGSQEDGLALVPNAAKTTSTSYWSVTFNGEDLAEAIHISTAITYAQASPDKTTTPTSKPTTPGTTSSTAPTTTGGSFTDVGPPIPDGTTETLAPQAAPQLAPNAPQTTTSNAGTTASGNDIQDAAFEGSFRYPLAFLVPLALVIGGAFLIRMFTGDATPIKMDRT